MSADLKAADSDEIKKIIQTIVNKNRGDLTDEELIQQEEAMIKIFDQGLLPGEALGFSEEFLEVVYGFAYSLYQKNKIEEASQLYRWLKTMVPVNPRYTTALMHCYIQQKKWLPAVALLMEVAYFNPEDPYPFEKMSDCLIEAEHYGFALTAIEKAIERAGDKPEYAADKERWLLTFDYIINLMEIDPALVEKIKNEYAAKQH